MVASSEIAVKKRSQLRRTCSCGMNDLSSIAEKATVQDIPESLAQVPDHPPFSTGIEDKKVILSTIASAVQLTCE